MPEWLGEFRAKKRGEDRESLLPSIAAEGLKSGGRAKNRLVGFSGWRRIEK